jgi:hypothetical protein
MKWRKLIADSTSKEPGAYQNWTYEDTKKSVPFILYNEIMRLVDNFGNYLIWYTR